jgi:hypothetical protein
VAEALSRKDYEQKVEEHRLLTFDRTRIAMVEDRIPKLLRKKCILWYRLAGRRALAIPSSAF